MATASLSPQEVNFDTDYSGLSVVGSSELVLKNAENVHCENVSREKTEKKETRKEEDEKSDES